MSKIEFKKIDYNTFHNDTITLIKKVLKKYPNIKYVYGIPRGGTFPAIIASHYFDLEYLDYLNSINLEKERDDILIIDDINDTGMTLKNLSFKYPNFIYVTVYAKLHSKFKTNIEPIEVYNNTWLVFPFENEKKVKYEYKDFKKRRKNV